MIKAGRQAVQGGTASARQRTAGSDQMAQASVAALPPSVLPIPSGEFFPQRPAAIVADVGARALELRAAMEADRCGKIAREAERLSNPVPVALAGADRVRAREARIDRLANTFGWGQGERAVIELIQQAAEAGLTGAYVPAQRIIEKVDGTTKSHDMIGGSLDRDAKLIAWYAAMRADWTARGVPWFGMILVLVSGFEIKRAAIVIHRREQWLRDQIRLEVERLKAALDKGGVKHA